MSTNASTNVEEPVLSDGGLFIVLILTVAGMATLVAGILCGTIYLAIGVIALAAVALLILVVAWLREVRIDSPPPPLPPPSAPQGRLRRFISKGLVWAIFVVGAAFVPFVFRYIYGSLPPEKPTPWASVFHQPDLVIIILAVAAGAFAEKFVAALRERELNWLLIFLPIAQVILLGCWAGWVIDGIETGHLGGFSGSLRLWLIFGMVLYMSAKSLYDVADDEYEAERRAMERSHMSDFISNSMSSVADVLLRSVHAIRK